MITKCINPNCSAEFDDLSLGQIYVLERHFERKQEFYWLCQTCLPEFSIALSENGVLAGC